MLHSGQQTSDDSPICKKKHMWSYSVIECCNNVPFLYDIDMERQQWAEILYMDYES